MDDERTYLEPDFDPSTLTVPRLRSILVAHNISYPSSAKKPDLISLFSDNIATQATKLRNAQSRTKRSARGIVDVPSATASAAGDDDNDAEIEDTIVVEPASTRRSSRRTTRALTEDAVQATPKVARSSRQSTAPLTVKRSPSKRARNEDTDSAADIESKRLAPRRTKEAVTPGAASRVQYEQPPYQEGPESPFSKDNPFQSGSPPASAERHQSGDRRRTTLGSASDRDRARSKDARRRTDTYKAVKQDDGVVVPSSSTFEMPLARTRNKRYEEEVDEVPAGEEFTAEEQLDLTSTRGQTSESGVVARRRKQPRSGVAKAAPWSVLVALLGGVATVWQQEKLQVGYCGVGQPSASLAGVQVPEWASFVQPQCEPCPQHAYCYEGLKTVCEPDFVLVAHPLSLGGALPLPPTCEPDSEKVRKIKQVADFAVETQLRERNAQYECGEAPSPDIAEEELKEVVSAKRSRRMTDEEFDELWDHALGEIVGREEVVSKVDGERLLLHSTSIARISLACAARRSLRQSLRAHLPKLVALIALALSGVYGRHALVTRRSTSTRAKQLTGLTLDKLATQASLHATDPAAYAEPWVSMVALRDDVLREEFSAKERGRLWDVVRGLVEGNANVRTMVREGRTGEVSRVWEWIGAVQRIESPESVRRQSGRFSLGGAGRLAGSPSLGYLGDGKEESDGVPNGAEMSQVQKWEEGRSYY